METKIGALLSFVAAPIALLTLIGFGDLFR